jgi:hypothetical protein
MVIPQADPERFVVYRSFALPELAVHPAFI